ncbi:hypothetical protein D3C80_498300 [compost metagenome]
MNHPPVELRGFGVGQKRLVLLAMLFAGNLRTFGQLRAEPQRQCRHALPFEIDRHVRRQLVDAGLLRAVRRAMHVAPGTERRSEANQPLCTFEQQRRGVEAGDVGRAQTDV